MFCQQMANKPDVVWSVLNSFLYTMSCFGESERHGSGVGDGSRLHKLCFGSSIKWETAISYGRDWDLDPTPFSNCESSCSAGRTPLVLTTDDRTGPPREAAPSESTCLWNQDVWIPLNDVNLVLCRGWWYLFQFSYDFFIITYFIPPTRFMLTCVILFS